MESDQVMGAKILFTFAPGTGFPLVPLSTRHRRLHFSIPILPPLGSIGAHTSSYTEYYN